MHGKSKCFDYNAHFFEEHIVQKMIVWLTAMVLMLFVGDSAQAQWFPGNGMLWPNKVPFGFYGAGINPYMGIQGNYGPAMMPSPQPLYVQGRNSGSINPVTGRVQGWGTTNINASYQLQPQEYFVPPPPSRQDVIPRMRMEEEQRRLQQQRQQQYTPQSPTPLDSSPGPVPNPPTARRQYQLQPEQPKANGNPYVAQDTIPRNQPQILPTSINRNR